MTCLSNLVCLCVKAYTLDNKALRKETTLVKHLVSGLKSIGMNGSIELSWTGRRMTGCVVVVIWARRVFEIKSKVSQDTFGKTVCARPGRKL